ncbi:FAD-dependent oxidoreductase [Gracilibacillus salinarum]|uniref:FAD-dependent oxidoreductase n=1 Tax=Gracilibacillus salinarum TaxID=2932255 RepID=A0ABY4GNP6_9BACI|nr:FAD-dependent oxidoreductase [Gracilibacillus salinarum]UOQ85818.1 FAD-dependent oxidoreductase [Gracilibacillus salinarum]
MHTSIWLDTEIKPFQPLHDSLQTDVTIIGGGITGVLTAYHLAKQGVKVVLLERDRLSQSTTGHTTAKITAQHDLIYDELIQHFGEENASLYYQSQKEAMAFYHKTIKMFQINCHYQQEHAYLYTNQPNNREKLEKESEAYQKLAIEGTLVDQIPFSFPHLKALRMNTQAQFDPRTFLKTIVAEIEKYQGHIYERTTAVDIDYQSNTIVRTARGHNIITDNVVVATQFPFYEGKAFYSTRMYPSRSYVVGFTSSEAYPGGMYLDVDQPIRSIRHVQKEDKTIWLLGGQAHKTGQQQQHADPYTELTQFANRYLRSQAFHYQWSAQDYETLDKLPYIGALNKRHPNVFVATGYRKWGMTNSAVAAQLLADLIVGKENPYKKLYQPQRFHADPDLKAFMRNNSDVATEFIKGKLSKTDRVEQLKPNSSAKIKHDGKTIGVYKDDDDQLHAVDPTCTHLGCECNWNQSEKSWDCPCHGSRFNYDGKVIEGPATKNLNKLSL